MIRSRETTQTGAQPSPRWMLRRHPMLAVFTIGYLAIVAWVTLGPQPLDHQESRILFRVLRFFSDHGSTSWITYDRVQYGANVAMFVPIGLLFLLILGRRRWWLATLIGVLLTITIEVSQRGIPGRVSDPGDVLANSAGAFLGVIAALIITTPAALRDRRQRREHEQRLAAEARRASAGDRPTPTLPLPVSR